MTKYKYDLIAYGDAAPVSRRARKSPGEVQVLLDQPYGSRLVGLRLEVNPTTGHWELLEIRGHERISINEGSITPEGVTCLDPNRV
jgi:hypothetical protein